jgi:uncharacterized cupin superfamily protein
MTVGDQNHELLPGDAVLASAGVAHDLVNTGDEPLRVIVVRRNAARLLAQYEKSNTFHTFVRHLKRRCVCNVDHSQLGKSFKLRQAVS